MRSVQVGTRSVLSPPGLSNGDNSVPSDFPVDGTNRQSASSRRSRMAKQQTSFERSADIAAASSSTTAKTLCAVSSAEFGEAGRARAVDISSRFGHVLAEEKRGYWPRRVHVI